MFQLGHELRTPVNHIIGYGEMLQEQAEDLCRPKLLADLHKITGAARLWLASMEACLVAPGTDPAQARPQKPEAPTTGPGFAPPAPAAQTDLVRVSNRLLVVDDDEANRELLARRLRRQGFTPTVVAGGVEALQALRAQPFDLVLLDLVMPGLDGYQVLTRLKSDPALAALPVIMISAMDQVEGIARCLEAGAEDYLPKPFDPVLLRARVGAALERKQLLDAERVYLKQIEDERARSERLLLNVLPRPIADRLKGGETLIVDSFEEVTVLFADLVGFTRLAEQLSPARGVDAAKVHEDG